MNATLSDKRAPSCHFIYLFFLWLNWKQPFIAHKWELLNGVSPLEMPIKLLLTLVCLQCGGGSSKEFFQKQSVT